jgi:hypothetical protein
VRIVYATLALVAAALLGGGLTAALLSMRMPPISAPAYAGALTSTNVEQLTVTATVGATRTAVVTRTATAVATSTAVATRTVTETITPTPRTAETPDPETVTVTTVAGKMRRGGR